MGGFGVQTFAQRYRWQNKLSSSTNSKHEKHFNAGKIVGIWRRWRYGFASVCVRVRVPFKTACASISVKDNFIHTKKADTGYTSAV